MITFLVALVAFVLVLGLLVTVHEFGHFYFARKAGILCSEFAIGMGPIIYRVKKGETYYCIRAIPIGGFVAMAGEDLNENLIKIGSCVSLQLEDNLVTEIILTDQIEGEVKGIAVNRDMYGKDTKELFIELQVNGETIKYNIAKECYYVISPKQKLPVAPYDRCFESKTLTQRFLTIVAGPTVNLILALFLFLIVGLASGVATNENVIGTVSTYTAQEYLEEGDVITAIADYTIESWDEIGPVMDILQKQGAKYIPMTIIRDDEEITFDVKATIQLNSVGITNLYDLEDGEDEPTTGIVLGVLADGNKANEAGLKQGDILLSINVGAEKNEINSWLDAMVFFESYSTSNPSVSFTYIREDETKTTDAITIYDEKTLNNLGVSLISYTIGISPTTEFSFIGGIQNGFILTWQNATMIFSTLGMVLNPSSMISVSDLSGPIGIFGLVESYISAGFIAFLSLIGMLSINLFVVNLLPIPAVDGGRLVFLGIEGITKKPVPKKIENAINNVGFVLLLGLMIYITFQDFLRL